jgi:hypothetical protein
MCAQKWQSHPDVLYAHYLVDAGGNVTGGADGMPTWVCELMVTKPNIDEAIDFVTKLVDELEVLLSGTPHWILFLVLTLAGSHGIKLTPGTSLGEHTTFYFQTWYAVCAVSAPFLLSMQSALYMCNRDYTAYGDG